MTPADLLHLALLGIPATAVVGYPIAMMLRARLSPQADRLAAPPLKIPPPRITLVISAFNEEHAIRKRVENALSLEYPATRLDIVVVSDGSTDRTAEIVRSFSDMGVRLIERTANAGKTAALNEAIALIDSEIIVCTDANSRFDREALLRLVRWFQNPEVGAVCGQLVYDQECDAGVGEEEDRYWRWDNRIKEAESATGEVVAGNGSILAIRRRLAEALPSYLANDFAWLNVVRLRGFKVCYDPTAIAREETAPTTSGEFRRRTRIMTRGLFAILHAFAFHQSAEPAQRLSLKAAAFFFSQLIAKKLFRYLAFPALVFALALTPWLTPGPSQWLGITLLVSFLAAIAVGLAQPVAVRWVRRWPNTLYPIVLASASLVALARFIAGAPVARWTPERAPTVTQAPALQPARIESNSQAAA